MSFSFIGPALASVVLFVGFFAGSAPAYQSQFHDACCGAHENSKVASSQPTTQKSAAYSCPMHPEVTSDQPGKCPKCGMNLVKKAK